MDEFMEEFTLNELIKRYQDEHITFTTIHICTDDPEGIVIAVFWEALAETHFKLFKQQSEYTIKSFSDAISEKHDKWHHKICQWFEGSRVPLKLSNK